MRDKLIEIIKYGLLCPNMNTPFGGACDTCQYAEAPECDHARLADHLIANGVTFAEDINVPNKWIPVSERLPEEDGIYLISVNSETKGIYSRTAWYFTQNEQWLAMQEVTHWMPMPEPPKEGE